MASFPWMRNQFLSTKLEDALSNDKDEEAKAINNILRREAQRKTWAGIKICLGHSRSPASTVVEEIMEDGTARECEEKKVVEGAIHREISSQFGRADSAPVCQGDLFEILGYGADTETGEEILKGTFTSPPDTEPATIIILKEIAHI